MSAETPHKKTESTTTRYTNSSSTESSPQDRGLSHVNNNVPNEFTLDSNWANIATTLGTNAMVGAGCGLLASIVILSWVFEYILCCTYKI